MTRVSVKPLQDALEIEVETDGSVSPESVVGNALAGLGEHRTVEPVAVLPPGPQPHVELPPEFHGDPFLGFEPPSVLVASRESYRRFLDEGISRLLDRLFPLTSRELGDEIDALHGHSMPKRGRSVELISHRLQMPSETPELCMREHKTYEARLLVRTRIYRPEAKGYPYPDYPSVAMEEIDLGPIPLLTEDASFIFHGSRRCWVMARDGDYHILRIGDVLTRELERLIDQMKPLLEDRVNLVGLLRADILSLLPFSATILDLLLHSTWSQYSDDSNPLASLTHRTRTSLLPHAKDLPPEGREIKANDFGRLSYLETPEGPNIGLIHTLCAYAKISEDGEILTPYRKVTKGKANKEIVYLSAAEEAGMKIADAADLAPDGSFGDDLAMVREGGDIRRVPAGEVDLVTLSPIQPLSYSSAMIPFLGHNDPNHALMASNMMRQASTLIEPEQPLVKSGVEGKAARETGQLVLAKRAGKVVEVTGERIVVAPLPAKEGPGEVRGEKDAYPLTKFARSNQATLMNHTPVVEPGHEVSAGDVLADASGCLAGELALGRNVLVAYMPFRGLNFEDAICVSDELVHGDAFTSVHIEHEEVEVGEADVWAAPVGSRVRPGDVLVQESGGRKRALMLAPPNNPTVVIEVRRSGGRVKFWLAQTRPARIGDKFAGRNGNKGCIARILPRSEMPYLEDGTPVRMVLNTHGVISRMSVGQILETHFGLLAHTLGTQFVIPPFMNPSVDQLRAALKEAGLPETGMATLYDGLTGRPFDSPVTVGYLYMMKLCHMVDDKMNAFSTAAPPVANPLMKRRAANRVGFLEMWALEAYNARATLQEVMTVRAEDAEGRDRTALALLAGEDVEPAGEGSSLSMIETALRGTGISVEEER